MTLQNNINEVIFFGMLVVKVYLISFVSNFFKLHCAIFIVQ